MRIVVNPPDLYNLAAQWQAAARSLDEVSLQIQRTWAGLDWEVRQESSLEGQVLQARRQIQSLADEADRIRRFVEERASAFERADQEGTANLSHASAAWTASLGAATAVTQLPGAVPSARAQSYLRLGQVTQSPTTSRSAISAVRIQPEERRALVKFAVDEALDKLKPVKLLKDIRDTVDIPAWNAHVQQAADAWAEAAAKYGANSPLAQNLHGKYLEVLIFKMPFFGTKAEALIAILKVLGRMNPVQ